MLQRFIKILLIGLLICTPAFAGNHVQNSGTNSDGAVPQWNGANSNTLKAGLAVGTAANNLVQLDGSAKLPAVDGSQLTNIASGGSVTKDTAANFASNNAIIADKTIAFETDTNKFKMGDGATHYNSLHYMTEDTGGNLTLTGTISTSGTGQSSMTQGLVVNNGQGTTSNDNFVVKTKSHADAISVDSNGDKINFNTDVLLPGIKASSGTRYACLDTNGKMVSSASACSGT